MGSLLVIFHYDKETPLRHSLWEYVNKIECVNFKTNQMTLNQFDVLNILELSRSSETDKHYISNVLLFIFFNFSVLFLYIDCKTFIKYRAFSITSLFVSKVNRPLKDDLW